MSTAQVPLRTKQAGRTWHHKINRALQQRGFIPLESDHCVYVRKQNSFIIIIALYVDDLLLAASNCKRTSGHSNKI